MESVIRGLVIYIVLMVVFRLAGKRTLAQASAFELVLLLIISETVQQAMVDDDHSIINAVLLVMTLVGMSILLSLVKHHWPATAKWMDGLPFVVIRDGNCVRESMEKARVDEDDILAAARAKQGIARMDEIRHAVVETSGDITIVPRKPADE